MSFLPPATRKQRWTVTTRGLGAGSSPRKTGTNCSMPAIVKSVVDIASGMRLAPGRCLCPLPTKKSTKDCRSSAEVIRSRGFCFLPLVDLEGLLELRERARLQARYVHLRHVESFRDLGLREVLVEPEVDDDALARIEHVDRRFEIRFVLEQFERFVRRADVVEQRRRARLAFGGEFGIERQDVVGLAEFLALDDLFDARSEPRREIRDGHRSAKFERERFDRAIDGEVELLQAARHFDRPALVAEVTLDLADDRRRRIRRELDAAFVIEAVDSFDEADGADLDEVIDRLAAVAETDGEISHEIEMRDDELFPDGRVARGRVLREPSSRLIPVEPLVCSVCPHA